MSDFLCCFNIRQDEWLINGKVIIQCNQILYIASPFFTADVLAKHSCKSTGVINNINDGCVKLKCPSEPFLSDSTAQYRYPGTYTPEWNTAIINAINYACDFLATTRQNVKKKKKDYCHDLQHCLFSNMSCHVGF